MPDLKRGVINLCRLSHFIWLGNKPEDRVLVSLSKDHRRAPLYVAAIKTVAATDRQVLVIKNVHAPLHLAAAEDVLTVTGQHSVRLNG